MPLTPSSSRPDMFSLSGGLIYIGLIALTIFQALPAQRENPRLVRVGWWLVAANLANAAWIFLWHYQQFALTLIAMLTLLVSLLNIYVGIQKNKQSLSTGRAPERQPSNQHLPGMDFSSHDRQHQRRIELFQLGTIWTQRLNLDDHPARRCISLSLGDEPPPA